MSTNLQTAESDNNIWIKGNNFHRTLQGIGENIDIVLNSNNPPTVKRYTRFQWYNTSSAYTIPSDESTGDNEYSPGANPTYLTTQAIFEDGADQTFTWSSGNFPAQSDGTWYLHCRGNIDTDSTTIGEGEYGASKTETPTFSHEKGGWYSTSGYKVTASFVSTSGTVSDLIIYGTQFIVGNTIPALTPGFIGQKFYDVTNDIIYTAFGTSASTDWIRGCVHDSGTETVTGGGGDVTVNLGYNWAGGKLDVFISDVATGFVNNSDTDTLKFNSSYLALTSGTYTTAQNVQSKRLASGAAIVASTKGNTFAGMPNAATTTSFTLDDDGATTVYVKWFITA